MINDATVGDLLDAGFDEVMDVVSTGSRLRPAIARAWCAHRLALVLKLLSVDCRYYF